MIVMMIARTPSLNASRRVLLMTGILAPAAPRGRPGSEVEPVEDVADAAPDVADPVAEAAQHVAEALADARGQAAEAPQDVVGEHADEEPLQRPEGAEVAARVGLVLGSALPVRHPLRADHDLADVGGGADAEPVRVQRARGHLLDR